MNRKPNKQEMNKSNAVTKFGNAYGYLARNLEFPKTRGYCRTGSARLVFSFVKEGRLRSAEDWTKDTSCAPDEGHYTECFRLMGSFYDHFCDHGSDDTDVSIE
jgi:hypothetical protein